MEENLFIRTIKIRDFTSNIFQRCGFNVVEGSNTLLYSEEGLTMRLYYTPDKDYAVDFWLSNGEHGNYPGKDFEGILHTISNLKYRNNRLLNT